MKIQVSFIRLLLLPLLVLPLVSCTDIGYYGQCIKGHLSLMARCRPINDILADRSTPPELGKRLETLLIIRDFASSDLALPDNGSYRSYADLQRPYVVWNVVATPEFSVDPVEWCFPVAGCVPYRGYFAEDNAENFAAQLRAEGNDVHVYGVDAYSTLNWFDDPALNTFSRRSPADLAALIFHELAHQKLYIRDDPDFNEAFAKSVELAGVQRWLEQSDDPAALTSRLDRYQREEQFARLALRTRGRLAELYAQPLNAGAMRMEKDKLLEEFKEEYLELRRQWGGYGGFDYWFETSLSNARFASLSTYWRLVPAFQTLLEKTGGDLARFYSAAAELGELTPEERQVRLAELLREKDRPEIVQAGGEDR